MQAVAPTYPPDDPRDFVRRFLAAPHSHRAFTSELVTLLAEKEGNGWKVGSRTLYPHQRAQLAWAAMTPGGTHLLRYPPGGGKTLEIGVLIEAFTRLQMRAILDDRDPGLGIFCTAKPFHMTQQMVGRSASRCQILRTPPYSLGEKEIRQLHKDCVRMFGNGLTDFFPLETWEALFFTDAVNSRKRAHDALTMSLEQRHLVETFRLIPDHARVLDVLATLLSRSGTTLNGPNGAPEPLPLSPPPEDETAVLPFSGDAGFAIPKGYPVLARAEWKPGELTESPLLFLTTSSIFTSILQSTREDTQALLRRTTFIAGDEARRLNGDMFTTAVMNAKRGRGEPPIVFTATAMDYGRRWDNRSPSHTFVEAIEEQVLPNIGVDVFPGADEMHYPAGTEEALTQLVEAHFTTLELPKRLSLRQPAETDSIIVAPPKWTREYELRFRQEYEKRNMDADVRCFDGKTNRGKQHKAGQHALLQWFIDEGNQRTKVLIISSTNAADALDFPNIGNITIGTEVSPDMLYRLLGRLSHSNKHLAGTREERRKYRSYLRVQQLAKSNPATVPQRTLPHGLTFPDESFRWVPLQDLLAQEAYRRDERMIRSADQTFDTRLVADRTRKEKGKVIRQEWKVADGKPLMPHAPSGGTLLEVPLKKELLTGRGALPLSATALAAVRQVWLTVPEHLRNADLRARLIQIASIKERNGYTPRGIIFALKVELSRTVGSARRERLARTTDSVAKRKKKKSRSRGFGLERDRRRESQGDERDFRGISGEDDEGDWRAAYSARPEDE
jgi:hypothetical protein